MRFLLTVLFTLVLCVPAHAGERGLERQVRELRVSRDHWRTVASARLPRAIAAVPVDRFRVLVLEPAFAAWPCGEFVFEDDPLSEWSFWFDAPTDC